MKNPLVSVVMPVYNAEKYVSQAIESILNQTYKNFEFIIIDDCSTDNSFEIIKKYANRDKRIRFFRNRKNINQSNTLLKSIKMIKGKYFCKMDNDDISDNQRLHKQVAFLEKNKDYVVIGSNLKIIDENNNCIGYRKYPLRDEEIRKIIYFKSPFAYPSICIRSEILKKIQYPNKFNYCDDYLLWFFLLKYGKGANLNEYLLSYRIRKNQVKNLRLKEQLKETIAVQKIILNRSKNIPFLAYINHFLLKLIYYLPNELILKIFKFLELKK